MAGWEQDEAALGKHGGRRRKKGPIDEAKRSETFGNQGKWGIVLKMM